MDLPDVLATKDPAAFSNQQVNISSINNTLNIVPIGDEMNFGDMTKLRGQGSDPEEIKRKLAENNGYAFANLGLSVAMTTTYRGHNYLVLTRRERSDLGDTVANLFSGYIPAEHILTPITVVDEELGEEFLPITKEGKVLPGLRNRKPLPTPFTDVLDYEDRFGFQVWEGSVYEVPDLAQEPVRMRGKPMEGNPRLYFQVPTNSAQLVYQFHMDMPSIPLASVEHAEAQMHYLDHSTSSLHHSEDTFNPKEKRLDVKPQPEGLLLARLDGGRLTDSFYTFVDGRLKPFTGDIVLSEAFAPKDNGIVEPQNISLRDYLVGQVDRKLQPVP